jgi:glucokinase
VTAPAIFDLARHGDRVAAELVDEVCEALGAGLAVVVNGLNPERLLICGGVAESLRARQADILTRARRYAYERALAVTSVEILDLDKTATVRGGAALVQYEIERHRGGEP